MNEITPAFIKGLFFHAVRQVGGVDAAGAYLGISKQRVSVLQSVNHDDMPTILQVATLERVIGQPIVTQALADIASGAAATPKHDVQTEALEAGGAMGRLMDLARKGAGQRDLMAAALEVIREVSDVPRAAQDGQRPANVA